MTTYDEWRTTGTFNHEPFLTIHDTENGARTYARACAEVGTWNDGPHFHRRTITVTVTNWETA